MTQEEKRTAAPLEDPDRVAHMIAWRDRYIEKMQERVAGQEEEISILRALLFYALGVASGIVGEGEIADERELLIPKRAIADLLGVWTCRTEDADTCYRVSFRAEPRDAQENRDGTTGAEK